MTPAQRKKQGRVDRGPVNELGAFFVMGCDVLAASISEASLRETATISGLQTTVQTSMTEGGLAIAQSSARNKTRTELKIVKPQLLEEKQRIVPHQFDIDKYEREFKNLQEALLKYWAKHN
jgi:hypothetical protein